LLSVVGKMPMAERLLLLVLLSMFASACESQDHAQEALDTGQSLDAAERWPLILEESEAIVFRSLDGVAERSDRDTELIFLSDNRVRMLSFGFVGAYYAGTYRMRPDGSIAAQFDGLERPWPEMVLDVDGRDLLLWSRNPDGNTGGLPYRQLHEEDAADVQDTWYQWTGAVER
jgi:hypothetical protein